MSSADFPKFGQKCFGDSGRRLGGIHVDANTVHRPVQNGKGSFGSAGNDA